MELRDYLRILWGRRLLVLLCVALSAGSALAFSARISPTYAASAKVFVGPKAIAKDDAAGAIQELTASQQFVSSYAEILKSRPLAELVVKKTNARISADELTRRIETKIVPETRLIEVTVSGTSPASAALFANELVTSFVEDEGNRFGGGALVAASVLETALQPTDPVSPRPVQNSVIGGLLGLMLGIGTAFLLEQLDTTLRTKEDVERVFAPLPAIATIPLSSLSGDSNIFLLSAPNSPESEAIRILRTNIQFFSVDEPLRRVVITSTVAGEGKTTVAINLAASIAATDYTVLLIEADLRRPTLKNYFPDLKGPGLTEVLCRQASLETAVQTTDIPNLSVLLSGRIPPNPSELVGSERMAVLLDKAATLAEIIIIDTPPSLPVTDAAALAPQTDGVILVVRAGRASAQKALDVAHGFERNGVRVLGVAVNALEDSENSSYYYHYASVAARGGGRGAKKRSAKFDDYVVGNAPTPQRRVAAPAGARVPARAPQPQPHQDSTPAFQAPVPAPLQVKAPAPVDGPPRVRARVQSPVNRGGPLTGQARVPEESPGSWPAPNPPSINDKQGASQNGSPRRTGDFSARLNAVLEEPEEAPPNGKTGH